MPLKYVQGISKSIRFHWFLVHIQYQFTFFKGKCSLFVLQHLKIDFYKSFSNVLLHMFNQNNGIQIFLPDNCTELT